MTQREKQVTLLLAAVEELARERRASDDPHSQEEAEILEVFRSQLLGQLRGQPPHGSGGGPLARR